MQVFLFDLMVLMVALSFYAALPERGKVIFVITAWIIALSSYSVLIWIWLVVLDGMSWLQWFFGFAVIVSFLPAIAFGLLHKNVADAIKNQQK